MGIPLVNLLKVGGLIDCKVVAGHSGLNKIVTNVTVMEVPDIVRWLKGNELMLTSLYPIKDDLDAQIKLISSLSQVGTAALAIKPNRFVSSIPDEMIKKADEYGFPIIEIPEQISYLDILSPAMNVIFNDKVVLQEDLDHATRLLSEISLNESGFSQFLETLTLLTKSEITLESLVSYIAVPEQPLSLLPLTNRQHQELKLVQRPVRMERETTENKQETCIVAPILIDGELYGTITSRGYLVDYMEVELAILEKASMLLSLEFLRNKVKYEIEQQYKNDFFRDLLFNEFINTEDIVERGRPYGYNDKELYICLTVSGKEINQDRLFTDRIVQIESFINKIEQNVIIGAVRNSLYLLLPQEQRSEQDVKKIITRFKASIEQVVHSTIRLGVGRVYAGVQGLRKSFREAEQAVFLGPNLWNDKEIIHFNDLGAYRLLSMIDDYEGLKQFHEETAGKLAESDQVSDLALIKTLEEYFKQNESLTETANQLYIHVNTLKYRLQKIKNITGLSLQRTDDKVMLHIGLKIHHFLQGDYRFR